MNRSFVHLHGLGITIEHLSPQRTVWKASEFWFTFQNSLLLSRKYRWLAHSQVDSVLEGAQLWPILMLAMSGDQKLGTGSVRLLILVSEVQIHNVLSKSKGLDFPSNFMSVSSVEKASRKQNIKFIDNSVTSFDFPCWPWFFYFKRVKRFDKLIFIKVSGT